MDHLTPELQHSIAQFLLMLQHVLSAFLDYVTPLIGAALMAYLVYLFNKARAAATRALIHDTTVAVVGNKAPALREANATPDNRLTAQDTADLKYEIKAELLKDPRVGKLPPVKLDAEVEKAMMSMRRPEPTASASATASDGTVVKVETGQAHDGKAQE